MASSLSCFLLLLSIICLVATPTFAASRKYLNPNHKKDAISLRIALTRIDSGKNFTEAERIKRAIERDMQRVQRVKRSFGASYDVQSPVTSGGGEFLMSMAIGTPAQTYNEIMDTGSDLIWTQCQPCQQCFNQPFPIFNPQSSSTFQTVPCNNQYCQNLQSSCDYSNHCDYQYGYGDQSSIQGYLAAETMTFGSTSIPNIVFGCSNNNQGTFGQFGAAGIVGMGSSPLALHSQLQAGQFSYCLTSPSSSASSTLIIGPSASSPIGIQMTTPLSTMSGRVWWFITCGGMSIGGQQVGSAADFGISQDGSGGMMIDSGTTYSQIPSNVMNNIANVLPQLTGLSLAGSNYGFPVCLEFNDYGSTPNLPSVVFYLQGMNLELSGDNVWTYPAQGIVCLAMNTINGLGVSILGNGQQTNWFILYDLANQQLGFTQTNCQGL